MLSMIQSNNQFTEEKGNSCWCRHQKEKGNSIPSLLPPPPHVVVVLRERWKCFFVSINSLMIKIEEIMVTLAKQLQELSLLREDEIFEDHYLWAVKNWKRPQELCIIINSRYIVPRHNFLQSPSWTSSLKPMLFLVNEHFVLLTLIDCDSSFDKNLWKQELESLWALLMIWRVWFLKFNDCTCVFRSPMFGHAW